MKSGKDKTVTIALILLLTIFAAIAASTMQFEVQAIDFPTFLWVTASPNPVGVGQVVYVGAQFSKPAPTVTGWSGDLYENVTIEIVDPDGVRTVLGPYVTSPAAGVQTTFTPNKVGNYTLQAHYPGEILDGKSSYNPTVGGQMANLRGSKMLPSDSPVVILVVQEEPVEPIYKTPPLPTEFWTRPIYGTNWNWGELGANWFGLGGSGIGAFSYSTNFQPYGTAPNTPHIMWTRPTQLGGQPGAPIPADESSCYSCTSLLQNYFKPNVILHGILLQSLHVQRYFDRLESN